ncbi:hypothetical protein [Nannocystis pusilla]|uniref:hypothetical protein n=1 Tax=Nannocystis pusilla TaxID=889268 RepID=UPI003B7ECDCB
MLQALLLLRMVAQSRADSGVRLVPLNDPVLALGNRNAAVSEITGGDSFWLSLASADAAIKWSFGGPSSTGDGLAVPCNCEETGAAEAIEALRRSLRDVRHVPADRLGPGETYPLDDPQRHEGPGLGRSSLRGAHPPVWPGSARAGAAPSRREALPADLQQAGRGVARNALPRRGSRAQGH